MKWRLRGDHGGSELISGHGDGCLRVWRNDVELSNPADEVVDDNDNGIEDQKKKKKRKRDILGEIVQGLTRESITFSLT